VASWLLRNSIAIAVMLATAGCRQILGVEPPVVVDGVATPCASWSFAPIHLDPCAMDPPASSFVLAAAGTYVLDTDQLLLRDPMGIDIPVAAQPQGSAILISAQEFSVAAPARLRAIGSRGLIVASWTTIAVAGTIDVASIAGGAGAGADPAACTENQALAGQDGGNGAGGGGGGGFGGAGGVGGAGNAASVPGGQPGVVVVVPDDIRGGCRGGNGGRGTGPSARPGNGGGAIQLTARETITIAGTLSAGGEGGAGGASDGGGAGGGSGGLIDLDAPSISIEATAVIAANGGGGGGGSRTTVAGMAGQSGQTSGTAAVGGVGSNNTNGGNGSSATVIDGRAGDNGGDGAGGGGGGAGYVVLHHDAAASVLGVVSPRITTD
jgi:hypothetical protein